jgi:uncharacterized membrane protein YeaQ/YmgE (transglycosylase-associated protein family)
MNVFLWLLAGAMAGWIARSVLDLPLARALIVSAIAGTVGAIFGGDALAPVVRLDRGENVLSPFAVLVASVGAITCLRIVRAVYHYFRLTSAINAPGANPGQDSVVSAK